MDIEIRGTDKILIVAPHADDESIGCGGFLALYGSQCDLMLITDGRKGYTIEKYADESRLVKIRENEFTNAAKIAHVQNVIFLRIKDGTTCKSKKVIYTQDITKYDYIFVPNRYESHADHRALLPIFRKMKKVQQAKAMLMEYEVWTPLRHPTWFLDISFVIGIKEKMIAQHESQLADINYIEKGKALSCYRGAFNNTQYTEAFAYAEFFGIKKLVYNALPLTMKEKVKYILRQ